MRRPFIAGNWKMNLNRASAVALAEAVAQQADRYPGVDLAVCPPFVYLEAVAKALAGRRVGLGAQDCYHEKEGAFTGEVSVAMLKDVGCTHVILGHSERRHILGETDAAINKKLLAVLAAGLTPIVCVGELLAEREAGQTAAVIRRQFEGSLAGLTPEQMAATVIAYEPVWAIGTGKVATTQQAEEVHLDLRKLIEGRYNGDVAQKVCIQYGGSVKPDNAADLLAQPDIDGALVGGASLKADQFFGIAAGAVARRRSGQFGSANRPGIKELEVIAFLLKLVLFLVAVFMILLILIQRGKGGGLAGAFGGMGGQSAFGTKAGDTFTRITIGVAAFWILICVLAIPLLGPGRQLFGDAAPDSGVPATEAPAGESPASAPGESPAQ